MPKVLIVEDNVDLVDAYELVFEKEGFDVEVVFDGKQALEKLKTFHPEIVLLDIMMPYMNGFEFLQEVRKTDKDLIVVVNSNLSQDAEIKKSFDLGANEYLRKSDYTVFTLVDKIKQFLKKHA